MAIKKAKEQKKENKEQNIHKAVTAKNKSAGGKEKSNKIGKIPDRGKVETKNTKKSSHTNENLHTEKETQRNTVSDKPAKEKTLIIDDDELEGMTVPPKADLPNDSPWTQNTRPEAQRPVVKPVSKPVQAPPPRQPRPSTPKTTKPPLKAKSPSKHNKEESSEAPEDDDDEEESSVKQFSFPAYKILSGASVAPVQMFPQKVEIPQSGGPARRHWGAGLTGLFQNSKLTLKLRLLRLLLIWIFFRVLNKQTAWLSDVLGIGIPDEEPPGPKVKPPPGERFIKVFREGDPNPFHVRVKRPL